MGNNIKTELYPPDHKIFSEGLRFYGKPSSESTKTSPPGMVGGSPPSRPQFQSDQEYEEAKGYYQSHAGRIQALVKQAQTSPDSPPPPPSTE